MKKKETINVLMLENATGSIPYNMTNDYMFRAVLQKNTKVLKGLIGALLHLDPETLEVEITNPIMLGESFENKDFILDINVLINGKTKLNLEMQVINYGNWKERSLLYLCRSIDSVPKGGDYVELIPVIQIGFLDFDLFPESPEFYATYMMKNIKNDIIFTDKLQLSVVELNHIELATEEDRLFGIDKWAAFFKLNTWKELKEMAATNQYMESAVNTIFEINSDENIRELCRRRAEFEAYERMREKNIEKLTKANSELSQINSELNATVTELSQTNSELNTTVTELNTTVTELSQTNSELSQTNSELSQTNSKLSQTNSELLLEIERLKKQLGN